MPCAARSGALYTEDLRGHGIGRHRAVDDTPAGGGPGMVLRADVLATAIDAVCGADDPRPRLLMSPRGAPLTQARVPRLCCRPRPRPRLRPLRGGRRSASSRGRRLEEVSIGDYVLSGGEVAALVLIDACIRLLPGVMGKDESGTEESFESGLLEYPHYTRPRDWEGRAIPPVLMSGNHQAVAAWRREEALRLTRARRPDLLDPA